jgi:hypothetical protein
MKTVKRAGLLAGTISAAGIGLGLDITPGVGFTRIIGTAR